MILALALAGALGAPPTPTPIARAGPTFCAEWIRQSTEGFDRLTLFRDRTVVWKTSHGAQDQVRRKTLDASEVEYYCSFFEKAEFWSLPSDLRTGLAGDLASESAVTLARPDGSRKTIRFDELSTGTPDSSSLRAALEGLRGLFLSPLSPPSRYAPQLLIPGTLLKRFDGAVFRIRRLDTEKGFVEIVGVTEPYSQFVKIEELRFQFSPPEPPP